MNNNSSKKRGLITGVAAIFVAATLTMFGISGETVIEVDYNLSTQGNLCELSVYPPEEIGVDIVEVYCNDSFVTKTVLPNGTLKSIPFVFSNLENIELRFYKLNEVIGIGNFADEKLYVAFKDDVLKDAEDVITEDAAESTEEDTIEIEPEEEVTDDTVENADEATEDTIENTEEPAEEIVEEEIIDAEE